MSARTPVQTQADSQLAQQYQQKTDKQHILENPDTYIGSVETVDANLWVLPDVQGRITLKQIEYIPGLYKLFDEGIVNARDHVIRMIQKISANSVPDHRAVSYIDTTVADDGTITFENDGNGIDVAKHPENDLWIPEMIFGHLRTSTNYTQNEQRIVGGKNGFGFKLVLIWSTYGRIETVDHVRGLKYTQEFHNNLDKMDPPVIKPVKNAKPYTKVTFRPDYVRFGAPGGLSADMLALFRKRVCDIAAVTDQSIKKVKVSLNGVALPVKNFQQYVDLYIGKARAAAAGAAAGAAGADDGSEDGTGMAGSAGPVKRVYEEASDRWEYAVALSPTHQFEQVSFVNGICTHKGGKHVDYVLGQIIRKLSVYIEKKKKVTVNPNTIKEQLFLFLRCDIVNPAFDSQTKDYMNTPSNKFGSTCNISDAFIEKLAKMGVMEAACSLTEIKERGAAARKTDGTKTRTIRGIANFIDANQAGTPQSKDCVLILCEGLSAMSGVVSGLSSADRNCYGIYPLKGKLLNVRGENLKRISENKEITDLKKILGLETGRDYTTLEDVHRCLRYGKVMFLTDADADGSHIKGLCVNLFQSEWASLFRINGFMSFMNTPILRAKKGGQTQVFYNEGEYETWKRQFPGGEPAGWTIKYFKGLGTSTAVEFKEYFANKKVVDFVYEVGKSDDTIDKVFNKKRADERKTWLEQYDRHAYLNTSHPQVKYEDFVDRELIHFSVYDCERSIPNLVDGLKTSLRKILYCAFKRRLTAEVKVAQFSGYVSEHSEYHHGENSLNSALVGMAQDFVGSNNINLLEPKGQYGCLAPDTKVLMWDGSLKEAKDVRVDDKLVGDDGLPRTVLRTTNGVDEMYEITLANGKTFTVNSQHILTVHYTMNHKILWKESSSSWYMNYFDGTSIKSKMVRTSEYNTAYSTHFNKSTTSKEDAYQMMLAFQKNNITKYGANNTFDIKLVDYMNIAKSQQKYISMINNTKNIEWERRVVPVDPYIFGVWLGDGDQNGHGFTTIDDEIVKSIALWADTINAEITHHANSGRDDCYHYGIRRKSSGKVISIGDPRNSCETCPACQASKREHPSCDWVFEKSEPCIEYGVSSSGQKRTDFNPFKEILKKHNLFKNKNILDEYIYNDEETRLNVLAGFIDTDGTVKQNNTPAPRYEISQATRQHGHLIDQLNIIAQSLGFATSVTYSGKNRENSLKVLNIYGDDLHRIPTRIPRKKIIVVGKRCVRQMHYTPFKVTPVGKGEFYGWSIDGNERFLLGDFTITHNSRLQGGDDSASERYIFTNLNPLTRMLFPEMDDPVLTYLNEDGTVIEPEYYVPILPMVLVNGISGIGTGFSSSIPPFHPVALVDYLRRRLAGESAAVMPTFVPYYENFRGTVTAIDGEPHRFVIKGVYHKVAEDQIRITELPVGTWTMPYITFLEGLVDGGVDKAGKRIAPTIKDFVSNSTEKLVDIVVTFPRGRLAELETGVAGGVEKVLKLTTTVSTTNMHLFDADCKLKKYETVVDIIEAFSAVRLATYHRRKAYQVAAMEQVLLKLSNKALYIQRVLDGTVDLRRKTGEQIEAMLAGQGLVKLGGGAGEVGTYDYLIKMPMVSVSKEQVDKLMKEKADTEAELAALRATPVEQIWLRELAGFEEQYRGYVAKRQAEYTATGAASGGPKRKVVVQRPKK